MVKVKVKVGELEMGNQILMVCLCQKSCEANLSVEALANRFKGLGVAHHHLCKDGDFKPNLPHHCTICTEALIDDFEVCSCVEKYECAQEGCEDCKGKGIVRKK